MIRPTDEELTKDIQNLSRFYSQSEIMAQYDEIGISLTAQEFITLKYPDGLHEKA